MNLLPGLIVVMNHGDIRTHTANPGSQLIKILQLLAQRRQTKQELIEKLWGYEYSPLRHDSLIYGLLSRVRSLLGDGQEWVSADEEGYHLHADVQVYFHQPVNDSPRLEEAAEPQPRAPAEPYPASGPSPDTAQLINQRQFKILRYVEQHEFINLKSCQELLADVSKVTLSRDLSFLVDQKLLVRTGKGRNTAYMRAPKESRAHL
jgi:DNA-binding winged helix-turn-helix (wHTH) protein